MAAKKYDVCAVIGEKPDGTPRWMRVGAVIESDKGLRMKMDAYPASGDGWFAFFEPRSDQQQGGQQAPPAQHTQEGPDDSIPF